MLERANLWQPPEGHLDALGLADLLGPIRVHFWQTDLAEHVLGAVLVVDEFEVVRFELGDDYVLSDQSRDLRSWMRVYLL